MFVMVDDVRKMTSKKSCKPGVYGSFERLLFLFCCCCCGLNSNCFTLSEWILCHFKVFNTTSNLNCRTSVSEQLYMQLIGQHALLHQYRLIF